MYSPTSSTSNYNKQSSGKKASGRWTKEEHERFIEGLKQFGKNWKKVEEFVGTRNGAQIRSHAQKFFNRVEKEYNLKLDRNCGSNKNFQKALRKISESSMSTALSPEHEKEKVTTTTTNEPEPIQEDAKSEASETHKQPSETHSVPMHSPMIHFEEPIRRPRIMSADVITSSQRSFFDMLIQQLNISPSRFVKLSDLSELAASSNNDPQQEEEENQTIHSPYMSSGKTSRKMSGDFGADFEDTGRKPDLSCHENITKKVKADNDEENGRILPEKNIPNVNPNHSQNWKIIRDAKASLKDIAQPNSYDSLNKEWFPKNHCACSPFNPIII